MDLNMCTERDKDENTLDYILCTFLSRVVIYFPFIGVLTIENRLGSWAPQPHTPKVNLLQFKVSARMGRKGDSSGFECCIVFLVPDMLLWIFQKLLIFGDFLHILVSTTRTDSLEKFNMWSERRFSSSVKKNILLMSVVRGEKTNSRLQMTERWQYNSKTSVERREMSYSSQAATLSCHSQHLRRGTCNAICNWQARLGQQKIGNMLRPEKTQCLLWNLDCRVRKRRWRSG